MAWHEVFVLTVLLMSLFAFGSLCAVCWYLRNGFAWTALRWTVSFALLRLVLQAWYLLTDGRAVLRLASDWRTEAAWACQLLVACGCWALARSMMRSGQLTKVLTTRPASDTPPAAKEV